MVEMEKKQYENDLFAAKTFLSGENFRSYQFLGCHEKKEKGKTSFVFRVWAPNARNVTLVGDFHNWDEGLQMTLDNETGIWEVATELAKEGDLYKFQVVEVDGKVKHRMDPFGQSFELRPHNAGIVHKEKAKKWKDKAWFKKQEKINREVSPLAIYEVHAGSWKRNLQGDFLNFKELQLELIPYVKKLGYTHIEFMPLMEHPLDDSWGYQLTGYFALSSRFGSMDEFKDFVEACHIADIGVIMDWVPGHFCANDDALAYFDGTPLFEYKDRDRAINHGWGALNFDLGSPQVQSFLVSSAFYWLETFHLDGLRVDAVSNMLYRDYDSGPWTPNEDGGVENYEGVYFVQKLNNLIKEYYPTSLMVAEESSSWPKVTGATDEKGLGFDYKWNMGWMNDTLRFYEMDPLFRKNNFHLITFSFVYMYSEKYILPLSHDEVVHGKKSLMHKMFGDRTAQFDHLRNLFAYFVTHPGKQLSFMGNEWGQFLEWRVHDQLEWVDLEDPLNQKTQHFVETLNHLYLQEPSLWELDHDSAGMEIIDADNVEETVLSFIRKGKTPEDFLVVIINFTPVERENFTIGVPFAGTYEEILNTELTEFGGTWEKKNPVRRTKKKVFKHFEQQIETTLPGLGVLILKPKTIAKKEKVVKKKVVKKVVKKDPKPVVKKQAAKKVKVIEKEVIKVISDEKVVSKSNVKSVFKDAQLEEPLAELKLTEEKQAKKQATPKKIAEKKESKESVEIKKEIPVVVETKPLKKSATTNSKPKMMKNNSVATPKEDVSKKTEKKEKSSKKVTETKIETKSEVKGKHSTKKKPSDSK